jgi:hypothetical protein
MLRVTVEIVPHGDESRAEVLQCLEIAQVAQYDDDPGGLREYAIRDVASDDYPDWTVRLMHLRFDGASMLAAKALKRFRLPQG